MPGFDFDVVADPLPPRRIPPPRGTSDPVRKHGGDAGPAASGGSGEAAPLAEDAEAR
jgi:hypothetical protein